MVFIVLCLFIYRLVIYRGYGALDSVEYMLLEVLVRLIKLNIFFDNLNGFEII